MVTPPSFLASAITLSQSALLTLLPVAPVPGVLPAGAVFAAPPAVVDAPPGVVGATPAGVPAPPAGGPASGGAGVCGLRCSGGRCRCGRGGGTRRRAALAVAAAARGDDRHPCKRGKEPR